MTKIYKGAKAGPKPVLKIAGTGETIVDQITVISGTTSGTAGTRSNHAHGLNYIPTLAIVVPVGADDNSNNAAVVSLVSIDATNIVVKSSGTSIAFKVYVI